MFNIRCFVKRALIALSAAIAYAGICAGGAHAQAANGSQIRDVAQKVQAIVAGGKFSFTVADLAADDDPAPGIVKTVVIEYTANGHTYNATGTDPDTVDLSTQVPSFNPASPPAIKITRARYGVLPESEIPRVRDVTKKVQALADAGKFKIQVSDMAADVDPAPQVVKTLEIDYTANGKDYKVSGLDPEIVDLSAQIPAFNAASPPKIVVSCARYGLLHPEANPQIRDVTKKVQAIVAGGKFSFTVSDLAVDDDPAPGIVKTVEIEYTANGHTYKASGTDPDTVDLSTQIPSFNAASPPKIVVTSARYGLLH